MSDIKGAREVLEACLKSDDIIWIKKAINGALSLMTREKPKFRAPRQNKPLTPEQILEARRLRKLGYSYAKIAKLINTDNIGRVSEVVADIKVMAEDEV